MTSSDHRGQRMLTRSSSKRASAACSSRVISSVSSSVATPRVGGDSFLDTDNSSLTVFTQLPRQGGDHQNTGVPVVHPQPDHDVSRAYGLETAYVLEPDRVLSSLGGSMASSGRTPRRATICRRVG